MIFALNLNKAGFEIATPTILETKQTKPIDPSMKKTLVSAPQVLGRIEAHLKVDSLVALAEYFQVWSATPTVFSNKAYCSFG
jgi:hypothetical protein